MKLADLIETWLNENGYNFNLVNFAECKCLVMCGSALTTILDDRIHINANEVIYASDPKFFEKFKMWIGPATGGPIPPSTGTTLCLECSVGPNHPHPYNGHSYTSLAFKVDSPNTPSFQMYSTKP